MNTDHPHEFVELGHPGPEAPEATPDATDAGEALVQQIAEVVEGHWRVSSKNLGYYRTEITCSCGETYWGGDHEGDPSLWSAQSLHVAHAVLPLVEAQVAPLRDEVRGWHVFCREASPRLLNAERDLAIAEEALAKADAKATRAAAAAESALRMAQHRLSLVQACVGPRGSMIPSAAIVDALTKPLATQPRKCAGNPAHCSRHECCGGKSIPTRNTNQEGKTMPENTTTTLPTDVPTLQEEVTYLRNAQHGMTEEAARQRDRADALLDHSDTDECNACAAVEDQCPYHRGVSVGVEKAYLALAALVDAG